MLPGLPASALPPGIEMLANNEYGRNDGALAAVAFIAESAFVAESGWAILLAAVISRRDLATASRGAS